MEEKFLNTQFFGSKEASGSGSEEDTLFSEDTIECVLGLSEGPINGLQNRAQSLFVGETPLVAKDGVKNFQNFKATVNRGSELGEEIVLELGGQSSSITVNTDLAFDTPVVRQGLTENIDYLELRFVVSRLYKEGDEGLEKHQLDLLLQYRHEDESEWKPIRVVRDTWNEVLQNVNNIVLISYGTQQYSMDGINLDLFTAPEQPDIGAHMDRVKESMEAKLAEILAEPGLVLPKPEDFDVRASDNVLWLDSSNEFKPYYSFANEVNAFETNYTWKAAPSSREDANGIIIWEIPYNNKGMAVGNFKQVRNRRRIYVGVEKVKEIEDESKGDVAVLLDGSTRVFNGSAWRKPTGFRSTFDYQPSENQKQLNEYLLENVDIDADTLKNGVISIIGKTSSQYVKEIRFPVERQSGVYNVRVTKITPEDPESKAYTDVSWESIQEVVAEPLQFPNLATLYLRAKATDQFSSIPDFSGIYEGRVIKVPQNYNANTDEFNGAWDGTWKLAFTSNTAFIIKDLVENDRYGMASFYPVVLNDADIYAAGLWCSEKITDSGETRSRFTFNGLINEPQAGRELIDYVAGTFGGRYLDDGNGFARIKIDDDGPAVAMFSQENVADGEFTYSYTDITKRYNDITVTFTNPELNWQEDRRRVYDQDHIDVYGRIPHEFIAVGCTNQYEAEARARYKLLTGLTEVETVTFATNRQGLYLDIYDIILVADKDMDRGVTGRVEERISNKELLLREPIFLEDGFTYKLNAHTADPSTPNFEVLEFTVHADSVGASTTTLKTTSDMPARLKEETVFSISTTVGQDVPAAFRVLSIEPQGDVDDVVVTAVQVNRTKWFEVDGGQTSLPTQYRLAEDIPPVTGLHIYPEKRRYKGQPSWDLVIRWDRSKNRFVKRYEVWHQHNGSAWAQLTSTKTNQYEMIDVLGGTHVFRVTAHGKFGQSSSAVYIEHVVTGEERPVKSPTNLRIKREADPAIFSDPSPTFIWNKADDPFISYYELKIYHDAVGETLLRTEQVDKENNSFEYQYWDNTADGGGTPSRLLTVELRAVDYFGNTSRTISLTTTNPVPAKMVGANYEVSTSGTVLIFSSKPLSVPDFNGIVVHASKNQGFTPSDSNKIYDDQNTNFSYDFEEVDTFYLRAAYVDLFGDSEVLYSNEFSVQTKNNALVDTTPPGPVTNLTAETGPGFNALSWTNPTDDDYLQAEIFRSNNDQLSNAKFIDGSPGTSYIDGPATPEQTYYYWVRTVDTSRNRGPTVGPVSATVSKIPGDVLEPGTVTAIEIANQTITHNQILDEGIRSQNIKDRAISELKIALGSISTTLIQDSAILANKIANTTVNTQHLVANAVKQAQIAANAVGTAEIDALAVNASKIATNAVTTDKIVAQAINSAKLASQSVTTEKLQDLSVSVDKIINQAITSSKIANLAVNVQHVVDGAITGGKIAANAVGATQIADLAVNANAIADNAVTVRTVSAGAINGAALQDNAVDTAKLADNAITSLKIAAAAVDAGKIAANAVSSTNIADAAIIAGKLATNSVDRDNILNGAISSSKIGSQQVTVGKIAAGAVVAGTVAANSIRTSEIAANAVVAGKLAANSVETDKITDYAIVADKIATNAITAAKIAAGEVQAVHIASGSITTAKLDADSVTAAKIAAGQIQAIHVTSGAITTDKLAANAVTATKIVSGEIQSQHLAVGAVTANKIDTNAVTASKIASGQVQAVHVAAGAITTDKLAANVVTAAKIASGVVQAVHLAAGSVTTDKLGANVVTATNVAANAISAIELATDAVRANHIAAANVNASHIVAGAITTPKLAAGAVVASTIAAGAVTASAILAGAVTSISIATNAINATHIQANSITTAKLGAASVTAGEIAAGAVSATKLAVGSAINLIENSDFKSGDASWNFSDNAGGNVTAQKVNDVHSAKIAYIADGTTVALVQWDNENDDWARKPVSSDTTRVEIGYDYFADDPVTFIVDVLSFGSDGSTIGSNFVVFNVPGSTYANGDEGKAANYSRLTDFVNLEPNTFHIGFRLRVHPSTTEPGTNVWVRRLFVGSARENQTEFSDWSPGSITAIEGGHIITNAITTRHIEALSITANEIAASSITSTAIRTGQIQAHHIVAQAVTAGKIAAGAVVAGTIATNAVTTSTIAANAITSDKILANAISSISIASNAIKSNHIAVNQVYANHIVTNQITSDKLVANVITTRELEVSSIIAAHIQSGAITAAKVAANAIVASSIQAGSVTTAKIATDAITSDKIFANAVGAEHIAANSITASKIVVSAFDNLYPDPLFQDRDAYSSAHSYAVYPSNSVLNLGRQAVDNTIVQTTFRIAINPEEQYFFSCRNYTQGSTAEEREVRIIWFNNLGTQLSVSTIIQEDSAGQTVSQAFVTPPSGARSCRIDFVRLNGGTNDVRFMDVLFKTRAGASLIVDGSISTTKLVAGSITTGKIAAAAITTAKIATGAIDATRIQANAVDATKIKSDAIETRHIKSASIESDMIKAGTITADRIVAKEIDTARIKNGAATSIFAVTSSNKLNKAGNAWHTMATQNITPDGGAVLVVISLQYQSEEVSYNGSQTYENIQIRLSRAGQSINTVQVTPVQKTWNTNNTIWEGYASVQFVDTNPGTGSKQYKIEAKTTSKKGASTYFQFSFRNITHSVINFKV